MLRFGMREVGFGLRRRSFSITAAATSQFFTDNFTAANGSNLVSHVPDSGGSWSRVAGTGTGTIQTNRLYIASAAAIYKASVTAPSANYYVEAAVDTITDVPNNFGPAIRLDASGNGYGFRYDQATDTVTLVKITAGTVAALGSTAALNFTAGSKTFRVECIGTTINGYVDGVLKCTAADSSFAGPGSPGYRANSSQSSSAGFHCTSLVAFG
jgi:hypothetical protein